MAFRLVVPPPPRPPPPRCLPRYPKALQGARNFGAIRPILPEPSQDRSCTLAARAGTLVLAQIEKQRVQASVHAILLGPSWFVSSDRIPFLLLCGSGLQQSFTRFLHGQDRESTDAWLRCRGVVRSLTNCTSSPSTRTHSVPKLAGRCVHFKDIRTYFVSAVVPFGCVSKGVCCRC